MRYEVSGALNAAVMRRFERVVALPDPKNVFYVAESTAWKDPISSSTPCGKTEIKAHFAQQAFRKLYCAAGLKIRGEPRPDKSPKIVHPTRCNMAMLFSRSGKSICRKSL